MKVYFPTESGHVEPMFHWSLKLQKWVLSAPVHVRIDQSLVCVPGGYITDLASVPAPCRPIINTYGNFNTAALVHDWLYEHHGVLPDGRKLTRAQCDQVFYVIMLHDGVPPLQAWVMWAAVRINPLNFPPFKKW